MAASPGDARATTVTIKKPATLVFAHGNRPDAPGNCGAVTFVQWNHVPNVSSARAVYHGVDGTEGGAGASGPEFHDSTAHVVPFTAPPGTDWISVGFGSIAGSVPDDCSAMSEAQKAYYDLSVSATWVELTTDVKPPVVKSLRGPVTVNAARMATVGTVTCPADGSCTVAAPATASVMIARVKYTLAVVAPKRVAAGKTVNLRVRLTTAAATALAGRSTSVRLRVAAANYVDAKSSAMVVRTIKR